jgi:peptidoglycan hydrolase CwlO-like protein
MKKSFLLPIALAVVLFLVLPLPGLSAPLSSRIEQKREQIEQHKAKEGVLSTTIQRFDTRIDAIQGEIAATERRLSRVCAASWPRPAACWRHASSRSTRPTRPTRSR